MRDPDLKQADLRPKVYHPLRKVCAALAGIFTNAWSLFMLLELLVCSNQLMAAGRMDEPGAATVAMTLLGAFLLILFSMGWLTGLILSFRYYFGSSDFRILAGRFLYVTALELLIMPPVLLTRIFVFNLEIQLADAFTILLSLLLALSALAGSRRLRTGKA
jgi:hypothetical protein